MRYEGGVNVLALVDYASLLHLFVSGFTCI